MLHTNLFLDTQIWLSDKRNDAFDNTKFLFCYTHNLFCYTQNIFRYKQNLFCCAQNLFFHTNTTSFVCNEIEFGFCFVSNEFSFVSNDLVFTQERYAIVLCKVITFCTIILLCTPTSNFLSLLTKVICRQSCKLQNVCNKTVAWKRGKREISRQIISFSADQKTRSTR